ncbi:MAG: hypothetical protein ACLGIR_01515 [Actinomycetes bacterium]
MKADTKRLAELVRARMDELGWTQVSLAAETKRIDHQGRGISHRTISNMTSAARDSYSGRSARLVERALRWPTGAIHSILNGGGLEMPTLDEASAAEVVALRRDVDEVRHSLHQLSAQVDRLTEIVRAAL